MTECDNAASQSKAEVGEDVFPEQRYDAIVIGSGVGGSCAAALLAHEGYKVLLAEKRAYLGGRFSTSDHDGYLCAAGGLAVQARNDPQGGGFRG
jgi:choline dehydrogenase-like flavoprotein